MAIDQQQVFQAIYDLIFDSLTMAPAGTRPAMNAASTLLSLSLPGLPLDPAEYTNPWTPTNPAGNPTTAENFAWLVDAIPEAAAVFAPNGSSLEALYSEVVQANTLAASPPAPAVAPPPPPVSPVKPLPVRVIAPALRHGVPAVTPELAASHRHVVDLLPPKLRESFGRLYTEGTVSAPRGGSIKTFVETPAFRSYLDRRAARDEAVIQYMSRFLQVDAKNPADKQRWATASAGLEARVKAATLAADQAGASGVEGAVDALSSGGTVENNSVAAIFSAARLNFELSKLGSMLGPGYTWHMVLAQPQNWFTPEAPLCEVDLTTSRQLRMSSSSRWTQLGGRSAASAGLWGFRAQDRIIRQPIHQESVDIRVRFKFARVNVRRPWLNTSLFSLAGWSLAGRPHHALSNGSLTGNPGILPLIPSSIIIARDLQISANWAQADVSFIRERLDKRELSFGPFALSGRSVFPRLKSSTVTSASFDGVNITAPGLQVIGWLSNLVPACPPLDG